MVAGQSITSSDSEMADPTFARAALGMSQLQMTLLGIIAASLSPKHNKIAFFSSAYAPARHRTS
jgi:hypothetical protein